jgi:hypothetical protein
MDSDILWKLAVVALVSGVLLETGLLGIIISGIWDFVEASIELLP